MTDASTRSCRSRPPGRLLSPEASLQRPTSPRNDRIHAAPRSHGAVPLYLDSENDFSVATSPPTALLPGIDGEAPLERSGARRHPIRILHEGQRLCLALLLFFSLTAALLVGAQGGRPMNDQTTQPRAISGSDPPVERGPDSERPGDCPFERASARPKRFKGLAQGPAGAGKTLLGLQCPGPVFIDMEAGTDLYGSAFEFDVLPATTADAVMVAVDWLGSHPHGYRTLVIDPITVYWEALQRKWSAIFLKRNKGAKGHRFEYFDLGPKEWATIKAEWRELMRKLSALDMNVIVTAREKPLYAEGGFMQTIGTTHDAEKSLPYLFDVALKLFRDKNGRFMAEALKDRSNKLPQGEFEISYKVLADAFGHDLLTREARPVVPASEEQVREVRALVITLGLRDTLVTQRLAAYGADRIENLTAEAATEIIEKLKAARDAKAAATSHGKEA